MFSQYYSNTPIYACLGALLLVAITGTVKEDHISLYPSCDDDDSDDDDYNG